MTFTVLHPIPLFFYHKILPFPDLTIFQNLLFMHSLDKEYIKVKFLIFLLNQVKFLLIITLLEMPLIIIYQELDLNI